METFRDIEHSRGEDARRDEAITQRSPLTAWYVRVRDVPLNEFSSGDFAKTLRQKIYPEHVVPVAVRAIEHDPLAGELYDGELLLSFEHVKEDFWCNHLPLARQLVQSCRIAIPELHGDMRSRAEVMCRKLEALLGN